MQTDVLLGLLKSIKVYQDACCLSAPAAALRGTSASHFPLITFILQAKRGSSLKLIIMSATLDAAAFAEYFGGTKIIYIQVNPGLLLLRKPSKNSP